MKQKENSTSGKLSRGRHSSLRGLLKSEELNSIEQKFFQEVLSSEISTKKDADVVAECIMALVQFRRHFSERQSGV